MKQQQTNYSFETSLPAFKENEEISRERQCDLLLSFIQNGADCLLKLSERSGIPQAICSARIWNLRQEKKADYSDEKIVYRDRKRKKIVITQPTVINLGKQANLF